MNLKFRGRSHINAFHCLAVDGHASYPKFFWDGKRAITNTIESWHDDPPSDYDYQWSGNF